MNNKLTDLNNHLFAELERLSDEELTNEELEKEIERAKAITVVSNQIIQNGALALKAEKFKSDCISNDAKLPLFLEG
jgi:hypothetical protein